ncbi:MAG: hypothetical protein MZV49_24290 [Rhodopseudomonas palustris]|nr:hypothetical protein [Rhodopseudomonas palustris]
MVLVFRLERSRLFGHGVDGHDSRCPKGEVIPTLGLHDRPVQLRDLLAEIDFHTLLLG